MGQLLDTYRKSLLPPASRSANDPDTWKGKSAGLDKWHRCAEQMLGGRGFDAVVEELSELFHDDVVFHPPTYWKSRHGKLMALWILKQVGEIFGESFQYERQMVDGTGTNAVLEFSTMVDD